MGATVGEERGSEGEEVEKEGDIWAKVKDGLLFLS